MKTIPVIFLLLAIQAFGEDAALQNSIPEFDAMRKQYGSAYRKIEEDAQSKLNRLNQQYTEALEALAVKQARSGNLDAAIEVRNEKKRISSGSSENGAERGAAQPPLKSSIPTSGPISPERPETARAGPIYLCDLTVVKQTAYRFVKGDPEVFTVNEKSVRHGILAWGPSEVVFDITGLGGQFLEGTVGISPANENSLMCFEVYGDDKLIWKSEIMKQDPKKPGVSLTQDFKVSISGLKTLSLKVDTLGSQNSDHAIWMNPRLVRAR